MAEPMMHEFNSADEAIAWLQADDDVATVGVLTAHQLDMIADGAELVADDAFVSVAAWAVRALIDMARRTEEAERERERDQARSNEVQCGGLCLTSSDIGVPVAGDPVAVPHLSCPKHADPIEFGMRADRMLDEERARADRAEAALGRVKKLHVAYHKRTKPTRVCLDDGSAWPCATIRAIEGEPTEAMRCPGCDADPNAPHNGNGDCRRKPTEDPR